MRIEAREPEKQNTMNKIQETATLPTPLISAVRNTLRKATERMTLESSVLHISTQNV